MDARCPCTMDCVEADLWVKPEGGYKTPDPTCSRCQGTGKLEATFPDQDMLMAVWLGRCPVCGCTNGGYFQREGDPGPEEGSPLGAPPCINNSCEGRSVIWIREKQVVEYWLPFCSACKATHHCHFLQVEGGDPPLAENDIHAFHCHVCGQLMMWKRAEEVL